MGVEPDDMPHGCAGQQPEMMDKLEIDTGPDESGHLDQHQDEP